MYIGQVLLGLFMRNKMITLCPTSYEIARDMPNFSAWVRMKLLEDSVVIHTLSTKPKPVPKNYMCKHCLAVEDHWSIQCEMIQ